MNNIFLLPLIKKIARIPRKHEMKQFLMYRHHQIDINNK
jgi:hypothetical protein